MNTCLASVKALHPGDGGVRWIGADMAVVNTRDLDRLGGHLLQVSWLIPAKRYRFC